MSAAAAPKRSCKANQMIAAGISAVRTFLRPWPRDTRGLVVGAVSDEPIERRVAVVRRGRPQARGLLAVRLDIERPETT